VVYEVIAENLLEAMITDMLPIVPPGSGGRLFGNMIRGIEKAQYKFNH